MSEPARYQRVERAVRSGQITTSRGVDAVTGLPVLIYDFPGAPRLKVGQLDSEGVPPVLAAGFDGSKGVLVTAYPPNATPLVDKGQPLTDGVVLQTLKALRDAARVGLVHGDVTPERLLVSHGRIYVEGYGVPWNPAALQQPTRENIRAALTRDLVAAAEALLSFGASDLSQEVVSALKGALGSASRAGDAGQLYSVVRRLVGGAVTVPPAGFGNLVLPTEGGTMGRPSATALDDIGLGDLDLESLDLSPRAAQPSAAVPAAPDAEQPEEPTTPTPLELFDDSPPLGSEVGDDVPALATPAFPDEPDPITLHSDPGPTLETDPSLRDSGAGFVKDLPPGATYRAGNPEEPVRVPPLDLNVSAVPGTKQRNWRLPILVLTLVLVASAAGYLALVTNGEATSAVQGNGAFSHFVDVRVEPSNLPPVSLVVEQRPSASDFRSGTIIASVPRRVRFDAPGTWVVHASFQGRVSESVTLRVPEDTGITIVFPPEDPLSTP